MKRRKIQFCDRCELSRSRRKVVVGRGTLPCDILFIGEAPGKTENLTGMPFVGRAGKLLDGLLKMAGLDSYDTYITNVVMCRPCDGPQEPNREPRPEEILACALNVNRIISQARPRVTVLMGKVAQRYMGKEFPFALNMLHPSFLLRTGEVSSPHYFHTVRTLETIHKRLEG